MNEDAKLALLLNAIQVTFNTEALLEELWGNEVGTCVPSRESLWTWGLSKKYVKFKHYIVASIALPDLSKQSGMDVTAFKFEFKDWKYA